MQYSIRIFIFSFTILPMLINCIVIDKPKCGAKFFCPDNCNVSYIDDCPHNCNCKPIRFCPEAKCPVPAPGCIVVTKLDGCQTCICHQPVILIKSTTFGSEDTDFLFFNKTEFAFVSRAYREDRRNASGKSSESSETNSFDSCTPDDKDQVDQCLFKTLNYRNFVKRRRDDAVPSVNPLVQLYEKELERMCALYGDGLRCLGRDIYIKCRLSHFELATIDAFLGYSCGPKQHRFVQHYQCVQDVHKYSVRLQQCEDLLTASLLQLAQSRLAIREKQKRKCSAIQWFAQCERSDIYRHCSPEAAEVYVESLKSAAEYMVPGCNPRFGHRAFTVDDFGGSDTNETQLNNNGDPIDNSDEQIERYLMDNSSIIILIKAEARDNEILTELNAPVKHLKLNLKPHRLFRRPRETVDNYKSPKLYRRPADLAKQFNARRDTPLSKKHSQKVKEKSKPTKIQPVFINVTSTISDNVSLSHDLNLLNDNQSINNLTDKSLSPFLTTEHIPNQLRYVNDTLADKEQVACKAEHRKSIDLQFRFLFNEIRYKTKSTNLAFPLVYSYQKSVLLEKCRQYRRGLSQISPAAKSACVAKYEVYDQVVNVFDNACRYGSRSYYLQYFDCIFDARRDPYVKACEFETDEYLNDPSISACQPYGIFADCIHDEIVRRCGRDAWKVTFQLLTFNVKKFVENCELPRIYPQIGKNP